MKTFCALSFATLLLTSACVQPEYRAVVHHYGVQAGGGSLGLHTLKNGETLWSVANAYHVDLRDLLDMNHLQAPYRLKVGQRLRIPAPSTYKTKNGDTLYKVSRLFDATTTEIARLNNLRAPYKLSANQILRLPSRQAENNHVKYKQTKSDASESRQYASVSTGKVERQELKSQLPEAAATTNQTAVTSSKNKSSWQLGSGANHFIKPVSGKVISGFGPKPDGLHNDGVNIQAAKGDPVRSAESGIVAYVGSQIEGYGQMILIKHSDGYLTAYAHMDKVLVKKGVKVKRGQTIGTVGKTGSVKTPQLHFEIRKGRDAIDPRKVLSL